MQGESGKGVQRSGELSGNGEERGEGGISRRAGHSHSHFCGSGFWRGAGEGGEIRGAPARLPLPPGPPAKESLLVGERCKSHTIFITYVHHIVA